VIAAFEQRPDRARNAVVADLIKEGRVSLVDARPSDLSIDEILRLIMTEIRRLKRQPRGHRFAVGVRAGHRTHLPRGLFAKELARLVAALSATWRHGADDLRAGRPVHRPALQPLRKPPS
jgi:circadian clock protein KaiC